MDIKTQKREVEEFLVDFISSHFACEKEALPSIDNFFSEGVIDSYGFIHLILEVERTFNVRFSQEELSVESFSNLGDLVRTVEKKIAEGPR